LNMSERENGQVPLAKRTVRHRISADIWEQIKTGYAAGIGLREIARKMNIPEGTRHIVAVSLWPVIEQTVRRLVGTFA
jgi:hypothetical protein